MALYERLVGRTDAGAPVEGKINIHAFQAVMAERARGVLATNAAARDAINSILVSPPKPVEETNLTSEEEAEAVLLLNTITGSAVAKLARAKEIDDVLLMGEAGVTGYAQPTQVKTRLGV